MSVTEWLGGLARIHSTSISVVLGSDPDHGNLGCIQRLQLLQGKCSLNFDSRFLYNKLCTNGILLIAEKQNPFCAYTVFSFNITDKKKVTV